MSDFSTQIGKLHSYLPTLSAFEYCGRDIDQPIPNVLLFVAGLDDGLSSVPYLSELAKEVAKIEKGGRWVLIQGLISSSYKGWGIGSLKRDAKELSQLVRYLRSKEGGERSRIILMGHLTGCQDTMEYVTKILVGENVPDSIKLDGAILQAPVSDREAMLEEFKREGLQKYIDICKRDYLDANKKNHILPEEFRRVFFGTPITAYRFDSLASERGDDDYFSSYLTPEDHEKTFGQVKVPLLVLYGSKDEFVPKHVDRKELVDKWRNATPDKYWSPLSKVLMGATHKVDELSDEGTRQDLYSSVVQFIKSTVP